ncbi:MAG: MFS transporter, partial [Syntrophales bacterium LBB04]|nr:MFS transporter [Syntrophales bacterium LBB04]
MVLHVEWQWLFVAGTVSIPAALLVIRLVPPDPERSASAGGNDGKSGVGIGAIFEGGLARTTFLATLVSIVNLAGYWGAAFWIPTFLTQERGLSLTTMAGFSFVMYLGMFLGFQFFGMLSDWIGRRRAMIASFVAVAAAVAVYIVVRHPMFLFWWGIVVGFGLCGSGGVLGAYYAELFPERVRAYAGGFCWNMGR